MAWQAVASLPAPSHFDVDFEGGRLNATRWKKWMDEFEVYLAAVNITCDVRKKNVLLHCAGGRVQEIYMVISKANNETYSDMVKLLNDHFAPDTNKDYATLQFRHLKQDLREGVDAFSIRLRKGAQPCGFAERLNDELRLQLLDGCRDSRVKQRAFREPKFFTTFEKVKEYARSLELTAEYSRMPVSDEPGTSSSFDEPSELNVENVTQEILKKMSNSAIHKGSTAKEPRDQARKLQRDGYSGTMFYSDTQNMNLAENKVFKNKSNAQEKPGIVYVVQGRRRE